MAPAGPQTKAIGKKASSATVVVESRALKTSSSKYSSPQMSRFFSPIALVTSARNPSVSMSEKIRLGPCNIKNIQTTKRLAMLTNGSPQRKASARVPGALEHMLGFTTLRTSLAGGDER